MDLADLVARAGRGDEQAWTALVGEATELLLGVARRYRLRDADALDLCQATFLALLTELPALREPARLPAWLTTTARRLALRIATRGRRETPCEEPGPERLDPSPEFTTLAAERVTAFWRAVNRLPEVHCRLLTLMTTRPDLTHAQLAAELGLSPGSIGPLRKRCFDEMRVRLLADGFEPADFL